MMNSLEMLKDCKDERHTQYDKEWPKKIVELRKQCNELKNLKTGIEHGLLEVYQSASDVHKKDENELMNAYKLISELRLKLEETESVNTDIRATLDYTTAQLNDSNRDVKELSAKNEHLRQKIQSEAAKTEEIVNGAMKVGEVFKLKLEHFSAEMKEANRKVEASYVLVARLENENIGLRWLLENSEKLKWEANPSADYIITALKKIGISLHPKPESRQKFQDEIADIVKTRKRKCTVDPESKRYKVTSE
ncbi:unnamed protein product [Caenorhabditis brenneri]